MLLNPSFIHSFIHSFVHSFGSYNTAFFILGMTVKTGYYLEHETWPSNKAIHEGLKLLSITWDWSLRDWTYCQPHGTDPCTIPQTRYHNLWYTWLVMEHWLEREIAQWIKHDRSTWRPTAPWAEALPQSYIFLKLIFHDARHKIYIKSLWYRSVRSWCDGSLDRSFMVNP